MKSFLLIVSLAVAFGAGLVFRSAPASHGCQCGPACECGPDCRCGETE